MGLGFIFGGDFATPGFSRYFGRELNSCILPKYITTKKGFQQLLKTLVFFGAEDWTRTSTPLRAQEPESCVSTNSTTRASELTSYHLHFYIASRKNQSRAEKPLKLDNRTSVMISEVFTILDIYRRNYHGTYIRNHQTGCS